MYYNLFQMEAPRKKFKTVEEYISTFPTRTRAILEQMRKTIKEVAPAAEELISYNMPAFKQNGMLVWYAAYQQHIGFYPTPSAIKEFEADLVKFNTSKGAIQFPIENPVPLTLVKKIVKFRVRQNLEKARAKAKAEK
ncbi:MAG TPA: DUF1801 domain-containing protein [Chitinophagaceae bacterium]|nr:DUF1801 domain-containing protein [Chitinophagaceae bacterium]